MMKRIVSRVVHGSDGGGSRRVRAPSAKAAAEKVLMLEVTVPAPLHGGVEGVYDERRVEHMADAGGCGGSAGGWGVDGAFSRGKYGRRDDSEFCAGEGVGDLGAGSGQVSDGSGRRGRRRGFSSRRKGGSTVVRLTQTGWKDGDEWVKAYEYLTVGNAQLLATLHHRFVSGPIDWTK